MEISIAGIKARLADFGHALTEDETTTSMSIFRPRLEAEM